ncbi:DUF6256 family protein [Kitasatospora camelliae]|uniref:DUF6256 family protein n=1 Tax=Kitasatospora camelliae TaxID=3156397 RepID=A0AAU8JXH3_9ACTN
MLTTGVNLTLMLSGYLLVMVYLAFGLRLHRRHPEGPDPRRGGGGWPALVRHLLGTALGGYLLLMAVTIGYYQGVAKVGGDFVMSAVTGCALLLAVALPLLLAISWLVERRRGRRRSTSRRDRVDC